VLAVLTRRLPAPGGRHQLVVGGAAIAAALGPVAYARALPPPPAPKAVAVGAVPDVIQREQKPGIATIVEFADFEGPYCRRLHATLEQVTKTYDGKVRLVRKQHPLATIHPHAETAARAACCAEEVGRGDEMADALYKAAPDELTTEGCEKLAARVGADVDAY